MTVTILTGDARDVLKTLPDCSVQCVVTSPPYYGLRDYGHASQIGLEPTPDAYIAEMVGVFREVRRVLADDGVCWINIGDSYAGGGGGNYGSGKNVVSQGGQQVTNVRNRQEWLTLANAKPKDLLGIPWMLAFALRADGWYLRSEVTWCKGNAMPESVVDRPTSATEKVFQFTKSGNYFYDAFAIAEPAVSDHPSGNGFKRDARVSYSDANGARGNDQQWTGIGGTRNARNWWVINSQPFPGSHFATMAPDLAERCIKAGSSERGQCPTCRAPWERALERSAISDISAKGSRFDTGKTGSRDGGDRTQKGQRFLKIANGWTPTCDCPAHQPVPQVVLDPFAGAGTTALVASRLGRSSIGIELNPAYAVMARNRVHDDCPMFAGVAAE